MHLAAITQNLNIANVPARYKVNSFALSAYNLSLEESALLKSLIVLAAKKSRAAWRWTDDITDADVIVTMATTTATTANTGPLSAHEDMLSAMGAPPNPIFIIDANGMIQADHQYSPLTREIFEGDGLTPVIGRMLSSSAPAKK